MMDRRYVTVDVFTGQRFGGNPLAVVLDADGLDTAAMQAIAREFNYSETTFVLAPRDPANTAWVRIFTPDRELPFAGHPNVGTAFVLATEGQAGEVLRFEEGAGLVPVRVRREGGAVANAELTAPQGLTLGKAVPVADAAGLLGLAPGDVAAGVHGPVVAGVGASFLMVELASQAALGRVRLDRAVYDTVMPVAGVRSVYAYVREADGRTLHARMLWHLGEDAATGSAAVALAALLAEGQPDGEMTLRITQGAAIGRPSALVTRAVRRDGALVSAHVGGACVPVMRGTLIA